MPQAPSPGAFPPPQNARRATIKDRSAVPRVTNMSGGDAVRLALDTIRSIGRCAISIRWLLVVAAQISMPLTQAPARAQEPTDQETTDQETTDPEQTDQEQTDTQSGLS